MNPIKGIILLLLFIYSVRDSQGQELDNIPVTQSFKNESIYDILEFLEETYNVKFIYKSEWLNDSPVSAEFEQEFLPVVLQKLLSDYGLTFMDFQNQIVLIPRSELAYIKGEMVDMNHQQLNKTNLVTIGNRELIGKYKNVTLNGIVKDGATFQALTGATIIVENSNNYSVSGYNGEYSIEMVPGEYTLSASCIGFENKKIEIEIVSPGKLDIELFEKTHEINEIVVYAQKADENIRSYQMSVVQLDAKTIKQLPGIVGDKDIIKSLTMMPGVKSVGEFGSGINVRGGGEDQNLYLIDNTPVFNTSHVMGLLSVVNPDVVHNVTLYKGHIPSKYGERVSSVMDIQLQDYNGKEFKIKGGIGLYNSRLMAEGPLFNKKVTYKIGGRTSYSDLLLKRIPDYYLQNSSASFYDLSANIKIAMKNNPVKLFGYYSYDYFKYAQDFLYNYGNKMASVDWGHVFNSEFSSSVILAYSNYSVNREDYQDELTEAAVRSEIEYLSARAKFDYTGISRHKMEAGIQGIQYGINPGIRSPLNNSKLKHFITNAEQGNEFGVFINDIFEVNSRLTLQAGLRYSNYKYLGPRTTYRYTEEEDGTPIVSDSTTYSNGEKIIDYSHLEPRVSLKYLLSETSSLKMSYNKNVQYLNLLSYTSISTPEDVWKLSDPHIKPLASHQFALGYYRNFFNNQIETSVEVYYKRLINILEYKNGAQLSLNNHVEQELINADGYNYGIEFLIKKGAGRFNGWITYTYSRSLKQTNGNFPVNTINKNDLYPSQFDKPHDLTVYLNYQINRRLRFGCNFALASGRPITLPEYVFRSGVHEVVYYSDRNKYRLPSYHRLDLFITLDESLRKNKKWKGSWTFSILNIYGRKNAYSVYYKQEQPSVLNNYQLFSLYKLYLIGKPFPTLTYNFIF